MTVSKGALSAASTEYGGVYMEEYELEHTGCARQEAVLVRGGNRLCGELTVQGAKKTARCRCLRRHSSVRAKRCYTTAPIVRCAHGSYHFAAARMPLCPHRRYLNGLRGRHDPLRYSPTASCGRCARPSCFWARFCPRCGEARLSFPGGCELGPRPIDLHLEALRKLGAEIREEHGCLLCTAPGGLRGGFCLACVPKRRRNGKPAARRCPRQGHNGAHKRRA